MAQVFPEHSRLYEDCPRGRGEHSSSLVWVGMSACAFWALQRKFTKKGLPRGLLQRPVQVYVQLLDPGIVC